jgi:hypothetical protein
MKLKKIDAAIAYTKLRLKKIEQDLTLMAREQQVLRKQLDTFELIEIDKDNQYK